MPLAKGAFSCVNRYRLANNVHKNTGTAPLSTFSRHGYYVFLPNIGKSEGKS